VTTWLYTFGPGHLHPEKGVSLKNYYVALEGSENETRRQMFAMFGPKWSLSYPEGMRRELEESYGTRELAREHWPEPAYLRLHPSRKVRVKVSFEVDQEVPGDWDDGRVLFWLNESTFCKNNLLRDKLEQEECACFPYDCEIVPPEAYQ